MKPYIICHMMMSIDGRIDCAMTTKINGGKEYYQVLSSLNCNADLTGRVTAETEMCSGLFKTETYTSVIDDEFYISKKSNHYDVIIDSKGTLLWDNYSDDLIIITSKKTSREYLDYLKKKKISYIVSGDEKIDLKKACEILYSTFNIVRLAVVGGGNTNASFLKEGLLDEISLLIGPGIDGRKDMTSLFDGLNKEKNPDRLKLLEAKQLDDDVVYLRYKMEK